MVKSISNEALNELPIEGFNGKIVVIEYARDVKKVYPYLKNQTQLGFDTETRPSFKKGRKNKVALLQLSTADTAFLFRLNKMGLPKALCDILSDPNIIKTGVAIHDDVIGLQQLAPFTPHGFVEIQDMAKAMEIQNLGLKKLSGLFMGFRISKAQQTSNWELEDLSEAQLRYAATDAWVSLEIYLKMLEAEKELKKA